MKKTLIAFMLLTSVGWTQAQTNRVTLLQGARNLVVSTADGKQSHHLVTSEKSQMIYKKDGKFIIGHDSIAMADVKALRLKALPKLVLDEDSATFSPRNVEHGLLALRYSCLPGKWSTLTLPVSLTGEQVTEVFGEGTVLACYKGITETQVATVDFETIDLNTCEIALEAGKNYIVRPTREPDIAIGKQTSISYGTGKLSGPLYLLPNVSMVKDRDYVPAQTLRSASGLTRMRVNASYKSQEQLAIGTRTIFYTNEDGLFSQLTEAMPMKAFRNYMSEAKNDSNMVWNFYVDGINEDLTATGITAPAIGRGQHSDIIFDLQGRRTIGTLRPGIYIINGKKMMVR